MSKYFSIILLILTILAGKITTACTEQIDLKNDGMESMLVINCILTDNYEFGREYVPENRVSIVRTTPFFGDFTFDFVSDAKVWLDSELLTMTSPGNYVPEDDFSIVSGKTYALEVRYDLDGDGIDEIYMATTTIPPKYHLDSISIAPMSWTDEFSAFLVLHFQDSLLHSYLGAKLNDENNVIFPVYSNRILRYCLFQFDTFLKEEQYRNLWADAWRIRHEMNYDNQSKYYIYAGDTLSVQLEVLSEEYYRFLEVAKIELSQNNPLFSGPRSNVPTNIKGGALGIFGAYTSSRAYIQIPPDTPGLPKRPD